MSSRPNARIKNSEPGSLFFILAALFATTLLVACQQNERAANTILSGSTMGTYYRVTVANDGAQDVAKLQNSIEQRLQEINQSMSTYLPDSELSRLNRAMPGERIQISADLAEVLEQALRVASLSEGAFDVTVGPLVRLWGFGPEGQIDRMPDQEMIQSKLDHVGYQNIKLSGTTVSKENSQTEIDLSAIAKGFAIDEIAEILTELGVHDWLIDIGGELRAAGENRGRAWQVAIEKPSAEGGLQLLLPLNNQAIATSGDYRNSVMLNGRVYSHAIDPASGYPVNHQLASATVLHDSAMQADALATALLIMGEHRAESFARENNLSVYLIVRSDIKDDYDTIATGDLTSFEH